MASESNLPQWATPDRKKHLVAIFIRSRGFCVFGHANCLIPEHHYEVYIEGLIKDWKIADIEQRIAEYKEEKLALHRLSEPKYPLRGIFSAISRDIWASNQPLFYLDGLGMSGVTLKPFAKVRLSSSYLKLYIDLGNTLRGVSKSKRRKALRYGKPLPLSIEETIRAKIREAVRHYLDH